MQRLHDRAFGAAIAGSIIIAWAGIFVRLADVSPATSATARCAFAFPVLLAALVVGGARRRDAAPTADRGGDTRSRRLGVLAGVGQAIRLAFWHISIGLMGAGLATVVNDIQVVIVPLVAWVLLSERPTSRQLWALPVVLVGAVLIAGVVGADAYGDDPGRGALLGLVGAVGYSIFQLGMRTSARRSGSSLSALTIATGVSAFVTGMWGVTSGTLELPSAQALGWLLALALVVQVVGWSLISASMIRLPAATISLVLLIQPIGTMMLAAIIFGESPGLVQWIGTVLVLAGIVIAARPSPAVGMVQPRSTAPPT